MKIPATLADSPSTPVDDPASATRVYYVDTCGAWMLNAFLDDDLRALEGRHREYLAFFLNAYCDPASRLVGVVPTENREIELLPDVYRELRQQDEIASPDIIGAAGLSTDAELLTGQFDIFKRHVAANRALILRFARFHTHPKVAPGFYSATGHEEITPGVPEFVEKFLELKREDLQHLSRNDGETATCLKQAFAIFQRGFKYAAASSASGAHYITHPLRWSCSGFGTPMLNIPEFAHILGAIIASSAEDWQVRDSADFYFRLKRLRDAAAEWRPKVESLQARVVQSTSAHERDLALKDVEKYLCQLAGGWFGGRLEDTASKNLAELVGALAGTFAKLVGGDAASTLVTAGAVSSSLLLFAAPFKVGPTVGRVFRKWFDYRLPDFLPQSCGGCGAALNDADSRQTCSVCSAVYLDGTWTGRHAIAPAD